MEPLARLPVFLALDNKRAVLAGGSAAAAKSAAEASSSKAPMAIAAPFRSSSPQPRACTVTGPRGGSATIAAMSSDTSVA